MNKYIKILILFVTLVLVLGIYKYFNQSKKINYLPLGDSIAEGMNSYFEIGYSYTDYIRDYLKEHNKLGFYTKSFTKSGYKTADLKRDIDDNRVIEIDGKKVYLKEALRESDLVTLTIGANDFISKYNLQNFTSKIANTAEAKKNTDIAIENLKDLISIIRTYAKNRIIITGYFNPFPRLTEQKEMIDEIVKYFNYSIEQYCEEEGLEYIDFFDILEGNIEALPNPINIHPSIYGYELMANEIIKRLE